MIQNMPNKYLSRYHETAVRIEEKDQQWGEKHETIFKYILQYVLTFNM